MDFSLSEEQKAMYQMARDFGSENIAPFAEKWDETLTMPKDVLRQSADLGLASIYVKEKDGGSGLSRLDAVLIFEALAMSCPSISSFISIALIVMIIYYIDVNISFIDNLNIQLIIALFLLIISLGFIISYISTFFATQNILKINADRLDI